MSHKKKQKIIGGKGLTNYQWRNMNWNDIWTWVEAHREDLMKPDPDGNSNLTIQEDPDDKTKEIWYLKRRK